MAERGSAASFPILAGICATVVLLFSMGVTIASNMPHPRYTPDGMAYARFAARDAGYSQRAATLAVRAFYERTPLMADPRYRPLVEIDPSTAFARSRIFENRVLYPWLVSLGLRSFGFRSLFIVSAVAYVLCGLALFWMLAVFDRPILAAAVAIVALLVPVVRESGASDLTDMLALLWWVLGLGALLRLRRRASIWNLAVLTVASLLFALTRPEPYLIVLPALAIVALSLGRGKSALRGALLTLAASLSGVAAYAVVAALTHPFSISEQLRWEYAHERLRNAQPFAAWYRSAVLTTLRFTADRTVRTVIPLLMLAATIYGLFRERSRDDMIVLASAAFACLIALAFNPIVSSVDRVVLLPLVPVFGAVTVCVIAQFSPSAAVRSLPKIAF